MKGTLTIHAQERFFERANQDVTRKKIIAHIANGGQIIYAKRMTATRSLAYIQVKDEIFKIIINRKSKVIISILPFNDDFAQTIKIHSQHYNNKTYLVELYPDCYNETQSNHALTKIYEINDDKSFNEIGYNHPFFNGLFDIAWQIHLNSKGLIKDEETEIENQTVELENKNQCTDLCWQ
jgi:hypothetical protein